MQQRGASQRSSKPISSLGLRRFPSALILALALSVLGLVAPATVQAATLPSGFSITPPWRSGSHVIQNGYGAGHHQGLNSGGSTNDAFALDFDLRSGEDVLPVTDGTVVWAGQYASTSSWSCYGKSVAVNHSVNGVKVTSFYAHLSSINVSVNQGVSRATVLGLAGNTGGGSHSVCPNAYEVHLHFAMYLNAQTPTTSPPYGGEAIKPEPFSDCTKQGGGSCTNLVYGDTLTKGSSSGSCSGQYRADYYNNISLSGSPVMTRCEGWPINWDWGGGSPGGDVPADNFSARWTGRARIESGTYTFIARADDGVRVWLDGALIIDAWRDQGPTEFRADRSVNAGDHDIKVEYYERGGGAVAQFRWETASGGTTAPSAPNNLSASVSGSSVTVRWSDTSSNESGFLVYRWNGSTWVQIANVGANNTAYTDGNLGSGTWYHTVCSYNSAGGNCASTYTTSQVSSSRSEVIVDQTTSGFSRNGCPYWYTAQYGYGGSTLWTYVNGTAVSCSAAWSASLGGGNYEVYVFVPRANATTRNARYEILTSGGTVVRSVNQNAYYDAWVSLGTYSFSSGSAQRVRLADNTGESPSTYYQIAFDAVRLTPR